MSLKEVAGWLQRIFGLLKQIEPIPDEYDVVWQGPYYIRRPGQWCPSRFMFYDGTLYVSLFIAPVWHQLKWKVTADEAEFDHSLGAGGGRLDAVEWGQALEQIEHRLRSAVKNFAAYNARVERLLPLRCRTGKIERHLTWPQDSKPPLPADELDRFEEAMIRAEQRPSLDQMTLAAYLGTVGVAYDAAFEELRPLSPIEKYRRKADGRHGGLLDLPPQDARAFESWYASGARSGMHPWEIVFGHPHGIMIASRGEGEPPSWRYSMWVDSEGWYGTSARMALALDAVGVPLDFHRWNVVSQALRGLDDVEVGPDLYALSYEILEEERPDALGSIRWDPIPPLAPISPKGAARVKAIEPGS